MLKEWLESLEDPTKPLLGLNYWLLKKLGMVLPKDKFRKFVHILIHEIFMLFVITQYMELFVVRSDMDLFPNNLKITMQCSLCGIKANTFVLWQKKWKQIIDYITETAKQETNNQNIINIKGKIQVSYQDVYTKYYRLITYLYCVLVFTTATTVALTPLIIYLSSTNFHEKHSNGTRTFPHFFISWMPFDKNHSPGCWITVLWHITNITYGAFVLSAYDSTIIVIIVFFGGRFELLRERSKNLFGSTGDGINDQEVGKKIRELHNMHVELTKHLRMFNSVLSPVMFYYVVVCSLILCASAYQLTAATNATQKILMAIYFIFGIAQLFIICWHSNDTLIKSQNAFFGPYESEWWAANVHQRKSVLMLAGQFQKTHVFEAGPFTDLTLSTCITILKGAYSVYTLLRK